MQKYGVQTDDEMKKHGSEGECPQCSAKLDMNSNPPKCPNCGHEPFESNTPGTNRDGD